MAAMTCRHQDRVNNPECSSYRTPEEQLADLDKQKGVVMEKFKLSDTPDAERFIVEDSHQYGNFLVLKVTYPSCKNCSYEGTKVMVFEGVALQDAIKWKKIDPHFSSEDPSSPHEAPGPIARFPASDEGWQTAVDFVRSR